MSYHCRSSAQRWILNNSYLFGTLFLYKCCCCCIFVLKENLFRHCFLTTYSFQRISLKLASYKLFILDFIIQDLQRSTLKSCNILSSVVSHLNMALSDRISMSRNVYVTCVINSVEYGTPLSRIRQNVPYSVGFSFSMLTKTYLSITENEHKNENSKVYKYLLR